MQEISIGCSVHYALSGADIERINTARASRNESHFNSHAIGQLVPFTVVVVWPDEYGEGAPSVNGQALLDGNDSLWVTSAREGDEPGTWRWPEIKDTKKAK